MLTKFFKALKAVYDSHPGAVLALVLLLGLCVLAVVALIVWHFRRSRRGGEDEDEE